MRSQFTLSDEHQQVAERSGGRFLSQSAREAANARWAEFAAKSDERFWSRVDKTDTCWLWTGTILSTGYGQFKADTKHVHAHRHAYELVVGPIPAGLVLDHLCRVTRCVNPAHLEPVTDRENMMRGIGPSAINARKTHCNHGHEFTPENTFLSNGKRGCRECRRVNQRLRKAVAQ